MLKKEIAEKKQKRFYRIGEKDIKKTRYSV